MTPVTHTFVHTPRNEEEKEGQWDWFFRKYVRKLGLMCQIRLCFEREQVTCGRKTVFVVVRRPPNLVTGCSLSM